MNEVYRLLVDLQYPPHDGPQPAGTLVTDFPPALVAATLALGWIELVTLAAPDPQGDHADAVQP